MGSTCLSLLLILVVSLAKFGSTDGKDQCQSEIVESIPVGLTFNSTVTNKSTFDALIQLLSKANQSVEIASFYWTLMGSDVMPKPDNSSIFGEKLLDALAKTAQKGVKMQIAVNKSNGTKDLDILKKAGAEVRELNFTELVGAGVLHTKFLVVDGKHFYLGSANMDWRALTQVKELGAAVYDCDSLAHDLSKVFQVYWYLGKEKARIPKTWPDSYATVYNIKNPLVVPINQVKYQVSLSSSPRSFNPHGRTNDIDAILHVIRSAKKYIHIAVMDYMPSVIYSKPKRFWPEIDDELRRAVVERQVSVRILASKWRSTKRAMYTYLKSLMAFNDTKEFKAKIEAKLFIVPELPDKKIPYARVNHNKYMVTDEHGYIGTSNWSGDYFINTAGVGLTMKPDNSTQQTTIRDQLEAVFSRDWASSYSRRVY